MLDYKYFGFDCPGEVLANQDAYEYLEVSYTDQDIRIIQELAKKYRAYAELPLHQETIKLWENLNDLKRTRPLLWYTDLPWNELNRDGELTCITSSPFTRRLEQVLRNRIYTWEHMPADVVLSPVIHSPMIVYTDGMGIEIHEETSALDESNNVVGHKFIPVLQNMDDLAKMRKTTIAVDREKTRKTWEAYCTILGDTIPVEIEGKRGFWYAPMDDLVQLIGTNELMELVVDDPDFVHACMEKLVDIQVDALKQYERLGALGSNAINSRIQSGAYGYTSELSRGTPAGMKAKDMWGTCASQFFTCVSPSMHEEFSLQYEKKWLDCFGLSYYGCCERLDHKMDMFEQIPNLRKVSCSPWTRTEHMAEVVGRRYVVSLKPGPACFAFDTFDEEMVRKDLTEKLGYLKDCNVEICIKDISTVSYEPERLFRWIEMVSEMIRNMD